MKYCGKYQLLLNENQKGKVFLFFICIVIGGLLEMLGVSLMLPLIMAVLDTSLLQKLPLVNNYAYLLDSYKKHEVILFFLVVFLGVVVVKNLFIYMSLIYRRNFIVKSCQNTACRLFNVYLHCDYEEMLSRNSNDIIGNILQVVNGSYLLLDAILNLFAELLVSGLLFIFLLWVNWKVTIILFIFLMGLLLVFRRYTSKKLESIGEQSNEVYSNAVRSVNEAILGFKEIQLLNREKSFFTAFKANYERNVELETKKYYYQIAPQHVTEVFVFLALCIYVGISACFNLDLTKVIAELSAVSMAAMRMLPSMNRINSNLNAVSYYSPSLDRVSNEFVQYLKSSDTYKFTDVERLQFTDEIILQDISYRYPQGERDVLKELNFTIKKGNKLGVIGVSGGGKTTLVDILLGYLKPQAGNVLVDGVDISTNRKGWMLNIGYIPQMIFMLNGSIRENILFGSEEFDDGKIWSCLEQAQLAEYVRSLPQGLDTLIGERGIRLSGGQRQRIGIARALYNDSELLVFDEATSALDKQTEKELMQSIYALDKNKTMIIIAHNVNTLENCDAIYKLVNGKISLV